MQRGRPTGARLHGERLESRCIVHPNTNKCASDAAEQSVTRAALIILFVLAVLTAHGADPPASPREFRAVWVATVGNIDWPSKPGLSVEEQQREAVEILDEAARLHLNAVIFQVRPAADALYRSELEPWSYYLTGRQGMPPEPAYDPLDYWIEQAHLRGLQLHAWFNPFRARIGGAKYELHPNHVSHAHPEWVKTYGNSLWLDPGEDEARAHTLRVIADVTRRYDLDGIHIDDYFYPYPVGDPETKKEIDFPDGPSWEAYRRSGGTLERADWRRSNVNRLIEEMHAVIRRQKPEVLAGISPFGIPRPGLPKGVVGFDQHDKLYADTLLWLRSGWCDYWTPQLYWKVDSPGQPYRPLLEYWIEQNSQKRHIWPGLSVSRVGDGKTSYAPGEILSQIEITRQTSGASGNVLFSMRALQANRRGLCDRLLEGPYRQPALVPPTPWLKTAAPGRPEVTVGDGLIEIRRGRGGEPFVWAIWTLEGDEWMFRVEAAQTHRLSVPPDTAEVVVTAVNRLGAESPSVRRKLSLP